jgi:hypothetical protein
MDTVDHFLNQQDLTLGRVGHKVSRIITSIIDYYSDKCIWEKNFLFTVVGIPPPPTNSQWNARYRKLITGVDDFVSCNQQFVNKTHAFSAFILQVTLQPN